MEAEEDVTLVPTSSMSFEKQVRALRAYVVLTERGKDPIHYKQVMRATEMARTQISGVNSFFAGLGLLEQTDKGTYTPTSATVAFYSEMVGDEEYSALKPVLKESELFKAIRNRIMIHGESTEDEVIDHLLYLSGEKTRSRAKRAIECLEKTSLIEIAGDNQIRIL